MPINNWNPSLYDQKHAFVYEYGKGLMPILQPQPGEVILDLGCGTGHLTQTIIENLFAWQSAGAMSNQLAKDR